MFSRMRGAMRQMVLAVLLAATMAGLGVIGVAAEGPEVALSEGVPVSGVLRGSATGFFATYQLAYPGNGENLVIEMTYQPNDPSYANAIGFKLYGLYGVDENGVWNDDDRVMRLSYADDEPATLTVQVFNYSRVAMTFELVAKGAVAESVVEAAPSVATAPVAVAEEAPANTDWPISGALVGNTGGAFGMHTIETTGDGEDVTVSMSYLPNDHSYASAFGFVVYDTAGARVATGASGDQLGVLRATFAADQAGKYTVQVYNYTDGVMLTYDLSLAQ